MPLNDLSYDELCALRRMTEMLVEAHPSLRHLGPVHFDLTPGAEVMIRIEARVPGLAGAVRPVTLDEDIARIDETASENWNDIRALTQRVNVLEFQAQVIPHDPDEFSERGLAAQFDRAMAKIALDRANARSLSEVAARREQLDLAADHEHEPAADDRETRTEIAGPSSHGAAPDVTAVAAGDGGQAQQLETPVADIAVADIPAPAPVAVADEPQPTAKPAPWTAADDDRLVQGVLEHMDRGLAMHKAATATAQQMGRPVEGTIWRCRNKLQDRIMGAVKAAKAAQKGEAVPDPVPAPDPVPVTVVPPGISEDLALHLSELRRKGSLTIAEDIEMLELMAQQWGMQDIAVQMQLDGAELKRRWDALSDLHEADEGRKTRSWTAKQLLPALQALHAGKAA